MPQVEDEDGNRVGVIPHEYTWITLARHLHTTPWDLKRAPLEWVMWGAVHLEATNRIKTGLHPKDA